MRQRVRCWRKGINGQDSKSAKPTRTKRVPILGVLAVYFAEVGLLHRQQFVEKFDCLRTVEPGIVFADLRFGKLLVRVGHRR